MQDYQLYKQWGNNYKKTPFQCPLLAVSNLVIRLQLSNYKEFNLDSCN